MLSSGAATASLTLTASGSTMFVDVDWSDNDFSTTTNLADGQSISSGSSVEFTTSSASADGKTVKIRYRADTSNPSSGAYTTVTIGTVDCNPEVSISTGFGNCSSGAQVATLTITNNEGSNTAFVKVEYKLTLAPTKHMGVVVTFRFQLGHPIPQLLSLLLKVQLLHGELLTHLRVMILQT